MSLSDISISDKKWRVARTLNYYAIFFAVGLATASLGPTLPYLAQQTRTLLSETSLIFAARSCGYLLGSLLAGRLYDLNAGNAVILSMLGIMFIALALIPLLPLLWLLTILVIILGVTQGALDVGGNTLLVWVHNQEAGPFLNGLHFFAGVGSFVAPIVIAQAIRFQHGITSAYWIIALHVLVIAIAFAPVPSPKRIVLAQNAEDSEDNHWLTITILLFFLFYAGAEIGFASWIFSYATAMSLVSDTEAAYLTSSFWGAFTLGRLLAIPVATRVKSYHILVACLASCLFCLGIVVLWARVPGAIWCGVIGCGLSMSAIFPNTFSFAKNHLLISGRLMGWFSAAASLGGMFLPWLVGQFFAYGPSSAIAIIVAAVLIATAFLILAIRHSFKNMAIDKEFRVS